MTTLIGVPWPATLIPYSCQWGRSRNQVIQESPRTRSDTHIYMGRPLWTASITWQITKAQASLFRYHVEGLAGGAGSVIMPNWSYFGPTSGFVPTVTAGASYALTNDQVTGVMVETQAAETGMLLMDASAAGARQIRIGLNVLAYRSQRIMKRGDLLQIGRRMYATDRDVVTGATGVASVILDQGLVTAQARFARVYILQPGCEMRLADKDWSFDDSWDNPFTMVTLKFIETAKDRPPAAINFNAPVNAELPPVDLVAAGLVPPGGYPYIVADPPPAWAGGAEAVPVGAATTVGDGTPTVAVSDGSPYAGATAFRESELAPIDADPAPVYEDVSHLQEW